METPERIAKLEAQVDALKEDVTELKDDVKEIHSRITTGNREIIDKIEAMDQRLELKLNASATAAKEQHESIQKEIQADIVKVSDRVDVLERWRWMIFGGAVVLGYVLGNFDIFTKIMK